MGKSFVYLLMGQYLVASAIYLYEGDWRRSLYWFAAFWITLSVTI